MKLIIQIPCWNEAGIITQTINALPRGVAGIDELQIVVIDDGSQDATAALAQAAGADEVIRLPRHMGLAKAFCAGVECALRRGADILVNIDADLQYPPHQIPDLIAPILKGQADLVIGNRLAQTPPPFPPLKMALQRLGSLVLRIASGAPVADAASGFRALNREALQTIFLHGSFSYTMESLMIAGMRHLRVDNVPIITNSNTRTSRLFRSIPHYLLSSATTILRAYLMYHPLRFFVGTGVLFLSGALGLGLRYLLYLLLGQGGGHVQSLILLAILALMGFQCIIFGLLADVVAANRRLLEEARIKHLTMAQPSPCTEPTP
jgi:glycosyltransferase involved in cell wall biosynthesis